MPLGQDACLLPICHMLCVFLDPILYVCFVPRHLGQDFFVEKKGVIRQEDESVFIVIKCIIDFLHFRG